MKTLKEFFESIVIEELHPELRQIAMDPSPNKKKQTAVSQKIRELTARGEPTGIEGNMPKGSSRAYLKHADPEYVTIDGKPTTMRTGLKIAIRSPLDKFHNAHGYGDMSLGHLQNAAENGDHFLNSHYRTLTKNDHGSYDTNEEGIFPPLVDYDHSNHEWAHVGHADNLTAKTFRELTRTPEFPKGISHEDFYSALIRSHEMDHGKYRERSEDRENYLEDLTNYHPLVQKFLDYHRTFAAPPHDLSQIQNMGVWTHPVTGKKSIVARDAGFSTDVMNAYSDAQKKKWSKSPAARYPADPWPAGMP